MKNKKVILCDAKAFCFGPISKLLTVSEKLQEKYRVIFLVSRTSKMLAGQSVAHETVECDTEDINDLQTHNNLFKSADLFINIMNPLSARFAAERNIPIIEIDSLFWMWEKISEDILNSEIYFIQDFEGVEEQMKKFSSQIKNPVLVGPIVKEIPKNIKKKNKLLINLGGMESASIKVGINTNYPYVIMRLINDVLEKGNDFDEIVCAGNKDILEEMKNRLPKRTIRYQFFEHDEFLQQIAEARLVISSPGLTTAFEVFNSGVPIFFIPPQNYSQYWNLDSFIKTKVDNEAINWNRLYPESNIIKNEEQKLGIEKVLMCTRKFETDKEAWLKVERRLKQILSYSEKELGDVAKKQKEYFDSLGGNGTETIVKMITELLDGART